MASEFLEYAKYRGKNEKTAAYPSSNALDTAKNVGEKADGLSAVAKVFGNILGGKAIVPGLVLGGLALSNKYNQIKGDQKRRAIFEALCWDPTFKDMDKSQLLEWYTTIYHFSPDTSLDKTATKELLRQFMTFGRVDIQTLKTLAETQKSLSNARKDDNLQVALWK